LSLDSGAASVTATSPADRELARRLLARETGEHWTPTDSADQVLRQLHTHLGRWFGSAGSDALLARALDLTRADHPALVDARLELGGDRLLTGVRAQAPDNNPADISAALVALVAAVIGLLTRLIGADIVMRLVEQVWPGAVSDNPVYDAPDEARVAPGADKRR
jgi:hypothetical protein